MKNYILFLFKNKLVLKVSGKNISNFIKKLKNNNIDLLNIRYIDDFIVIIIYKCDYDKLLKIKTIYDIEIIDKKGLIKIKENIYSNYLVLILSILSIAITYVITNIIFSINIVTNDSKMKNILLDELNRYGIKKYSFKKNYNDIQIVKSNILEKYRDKIEWMEIENIGTKYIIRYEPRILNNKKNYDKPRNIIAKKDSVLTKIVVNNGEIIKNVNTFVKKGDVVVSGYIYLNENIKDIKSSTGNIYGEVWYKVNIKYPLNYYEVIKTGNSNKMLSIKFLSKRFNIVSKYKSSNICDSVILKNSLLPLSLNLSKEEEIIVIKSNNNDETIEKAISKSIDKIKEKLDKDEYIKDYKILNKNISKNYIELDIFFTVIENITDYEEIVE